ncbi:MAG: hypothetical protein AAF585_10585 [Verrucomicrobiota bacterium]
MNWRAPAEMYGKDFGFGAGEWAQSETALVLCLLGLVLGLCALAGLFMWMIWREKRRLPLETRQLLDELEKMEYDDEFERDSNSNAVRGPQEDQQPWERDSDWWKKA